MRKALLNIITKFIYLFFFCGLSLPVIAEEKEICLGFTIITNRSKNERNVFAKQKTLTLEQIIKTQTVYDVNKERGCPNIKFKSRFIKHLDWQSALQLSKPLDQLNNESDTDYRKRKIKEYSETVISIAKTVKNNPGIEYYDFLKLSPAKAVVYAKRILQNSETEIEVEELRRSINTVKNKLNAYGFEDEGVLLARAEAMIKKYNSIDGATADSWRDGVLILWNDIQAQDSSIEVKNLLQQHGSADKQCIDVFVVPKGKSPSRNKDEIGNNGDWTIRGGAAFSENYFPRTTAGRGHAIILTQDARKGESRLAHELGHLLIDKPDAHFGKEIKDLMYEKSLGGSFLDEAECDLIKKNIASF